jgi:hypothetical protein
MAAGDRTEPTRPGGGPTGRGSGGGGGPTSAERPASALPSVKARVLAFLAILTAGICGALIGLSFVRLQCHGNCTTPIGLGGFVGAVVAAGGVAVVAVLTLRAMGEWRTIQEERQAEAEQYLEDEGLGAALREPPAVAPGAPGSELGGGGPDAERRRANGQGDSTNRRNPSA